MEKIVKLTKTDADGKKIGDIEIPVRSTAASLFVYKSNFGRDLIKDILSLAKCLPKDLKEDATDEETIEALAESDFDFDVFFKSFWVFARAKNNDIPPFMEWLNTLDIPPLDFYTQVFPQVQDLLFSNIKGNVKSKNSKAAGKKK